MKLCPSIVYGNIGVGGVFLLFLLLCFCFYWYTVYENLKGIIESVVDNGCEDRICETPAVECNYVTKKTPMKLKQVEDITRVRTWYMDDPLSFICCRLYTSSWRLWWPGPFLSFRRSRVICVSVGIKWLFMWWKGQYNNKKKAQLHSTWNNCERDRYWVI